MLRKLALTGLLQFVQRGTATQVFCGCALAFVSSGMQLRLLPYREPEANVLKTLVDGQLFLTFLLSFLLRVLPRLQLTTYEPLGAEFYGWTLLLSVGGLLVAAVDTRNGGPGRPPARDVRLLRRRLPPRLLVLRGTRAPFLVPADS